MGDTKKLRWVIALLAMTGLLSACAEGTPTPAVSSLPTGTAAPRATLPAPPESTPSPEATPALTESEKECIAVKSWDSVTLGEVIERLGEPDAVEFLRGYFIPPQQSTTPCDCATVRAEYVVPEQDWPKVPGTDELNETWQPYYLDLHYPLLGILMHSSRLPEEYPCLCPQMQMEPPICSGRPYRLADIYQDPRAFESVYPWPGFGRADLDTLKPIDIE